MKLGFYQVISNNDKLEVKHSKSVALAGSELSQDTSRCAIILYGNYNSKYCRYTVGFDSRKIYYAVDDAASLERYIDKEASWL